MTYVYRDYDQKKLNKEYSARETVSNADALIRAYSEKSDQARRRVPGKLDIAYGQHKDEVVDGFSAGLNTPVFIFYHGGYWRMLSQRDGDFMASAFVQKGISVVSVNYSLAPEASIDTIVRQCRDALEWVWREGTKELGIDPNRIFVGGSSAGGHLTGMMLAGGWREERGLPEDLIKGAISFSGLHDLEPIRLANINEWALLDEESAYRNSPVYHLPENGCSLIVTCGEHETDEFKRQSKIYAAAWLGRGWPCSHFVTPDRNHFDIVFDMCEPSSRIARELFLMIGV